MNEYFYVHPKQVIYWDPAENKHMAGIAYQDDIICSCCGCVTSIEEVLEAAHDACQIPIRAFSDWVDLTGEISGGLV